MKEQSRRTAWTLAVSLACSASSGLCWGQPLDGGDTGSRELHVVGIYEGSVVGAGGLGHPVGNAAVRVERPGKRVTLFLSSYEPVRWHVTVGEGSVLERVFASGYYRQSVEGIAPEVPVIEWSYDEGDYNYLYITYSIDSGRLLASLPKVAALAGLEVSSFQGSYHAPYPTSFVVDAVQNDPRLRSDYPVPVPPSEMPNLQFSLTFFSEGQGVHVREYTLAGPTDGLELLPSEMNVVGVPGDRVLYGIASHSAVQVDADTRRYVEMAMGPGVPELSWPMGMTFDGKRQRVLMVSLGGEGYLYSCPLAGSKWDIVSSMDNLDLDCLAYHASDDRLYGLEVMHAEYGPPILHTLDPSGRQIGKMQLPRVPFDVSPGGYKSQLASVGEYLVLLLGPRFTFHMPDQRQDSRMYLIHPGSKQVWLTYRSWPGMFPNTPPTARMTSPVDGLVLAEPGPLDLGVDAEDRDGAVWFVEFFANGQSLGYGSRSSGCIHGKSRFTFHWDAMRPGKYSLTARAINSGGATAVTAPVSITVSEPGPPPRLVITSPEDGALFAAPAEVIFAVAAADPNESLTEIEFRLDEETTQESYILILPPPLPGVPPKLSLLVKDLPVGNYTLWVRAVAPDGPIESPRVSFYVESLPGLPGTVGLHSLPLSLTAADSVSGTVKLNAWASSAASGLQLSVLPGNRNGPMQFSFTADADKNCLIECADLLGAANWRTLTSFPNASQTVRRVTVCDGSACGQQRFYRIRACAGLR